MAGPKVFSVRQPAVAGSFYPGDARQCRAAAESLVGRPAPAGSGGNGLGGIVPHAGWICSGAIAGQVINALAGFGEPDVVVVFGAVHTPLNLQVGALDPFSLWSTPGGDCEAAGEVSEALAKGSDLFAMDERFHRREHAVEVELPLMLAVWPRAKLLAIEVPMVDAAAEIGLRTARALHERGLKAVYLASSDLTHYGPSYRFAPAGAGIEAMNWAKENDRRLLRRVEDFEIDQIVPEVRQNLNACGGGAIAAMLAACKESGASGAKVLRHASSYETLALVAPQPPVDSVGYAAVVVQ